MNQKPVNITLDDLIALNDEMAALARAGVPLDRGLKDLADDLPSRLGRAGSELADRLAGGEDLADAMEGQFHRFPPTYRVIVSAGVRSGRLASALEAVASTGRRVAEYRRMVSAAIVYPAIVALIGWLLLGFFFTKIFPVIAEFARETGGTQSGHIVQAMMKIAASVGVWWPAGLMIGALALGCFWFRMRSTGAFCAPKREWLIGWLPGYRQMVSYLRTALFADILVHLLERQVPLDEAVLLAADATGDHHMIRDGQSIAETLRQGGRPMEAEGKRPGIPPSIFCLLRGDTQQVTMLPGLRRMSEIYHRRALRIGQLAQSLVPPLLVVVFGGSVTVAFALALFWPWLAILRDMVG